MSVYLVQHGKNLPKEQDPEQALSAEGKSEVEAVAGQMGKMGLSLSLIEHSPKLRARQTAEIFRDMLGKDVQSRERSGIKALDDPWPVVEELDSKKDVMFVGHLPFMSKLASCLVFNEPEKPVVQFENAGVVCLDRDAESGGWLIKWTLYPSLLV
jgi:phosphohistidine phosphatase